MKPISKALRRKALNYLTKTGRAEFYKHLFEKSKKQEFVDIRHEIFYLLSEEDRIKPKQIALAFNRDRTTVIHGVNKYSDYLEIYAKYEKEKLNKVSENLKVWGTVKDNYCIIEEKQDMLINYIEKVKEFNDAFELPYFEKDGFRADRVGIRARLLSEEFVDEYNEAKDRIKKLDALIDTLYVALGGVLDVTKEIDSNTFDFNASDLTVTQIENEIEYRITSLTNQFTGGRKVSDYGQNALLMKYTRICCYIIDLLDKLGYADVDGAFYEIHASNMSKLDNNGKAIYNSDGKVMKSDNYFKPQLNKFI